MTDRQSTHAPGCWGWGPRHYECALREIERLAARLTAAQQPTEGEEVMVKTPNDVMFILPLQPSGRSIGPRFVVHVPLVEAPAVKALQAEIEALRAEVDESDAVLRVWRRRTAEAEARADKLAEALRRYRNEVPLGHQPHMLAHEVDDLLRDQEE